VSKVDTTVGWGLSWYQVLNTRGPGLEAGGDPSLILDDLEISDPLKTPWGTLLLFWMILKWPIGLKP